MPILLALITYFGWGSGDVFGVYATRKIGAYLTTFYVFIFGFIIASLYVPFALNDLHKITLGLFLLNVLFSTAVLFGNFLLNEAFKRSNASVVGVIVQSFPTIILILSALFLRGGDIALNLGISSGFASIVAPISGASPTLFVALSYFIFKDKINRQQQIGIGICLIGIVLLSFFSK